MAISSFQPKEEQADILIIVEKGPGLAFSAAAFHSSLPAPPRPWYIPHPEIRSDSAAHRSLGWAMKSQLAPHGPGGKGFGVDMHSPHITLATG